MVKLYDTWKQAKKFFVKPKLHIQIGPWRNVGELPVWRRGPLIKLYKLLNVKPYRGSILKEYKDRSYQPLYLHTGCYQVQHSVEIRYPDKIEVINGEEHHIKYSGRHYHKLPKPLNEMSWVWNTLTRKKLRKWHLSWLHPIIQLPIWLSFHIFNFEQMWKTKYDDYRHEFRPEFTIVLFGFAICFTVLPPKCKHIIEDCYWEGMLMYIHEIKNNGKLFRGMYNKPLENVESMDDREQLKAIIINGGIWSGDTKHFGIRREFLQKKWWPMYDEICNEIDRDAE